jgi:hypothetical protein
VRRFEWLGLAVRMDSGRTVQRLLGGKQGQCEDSTKVIGRQTGRKEKKGRPRMRWMDYVVLHLNRCVMS